MPISATVIGRLGQDPETRQAGSSTVTSLSVASDHGFGDRKTTTWVKVSLWGKDGERAVGHLHKGDPVGCTGDMVLREYQSAKGAGKSLELENARWFFLPRSAESSSGGGGGQREPEPATRRQPAKRDASRDGQPYDDADLPF